MPFDTSTFTEAIDRRDFEAAKALLKAYQDTFWAGYCNRPWEEHYRRHYEIFTRHQQELFAEQMVDECKAQKARYQQEGWKHWDEDFITCNINRAMHEKIREVLPSYLEARITRRDHEGDAYGLIINNLSAHRTRQAAQKFLREEFVDNPHIPSRIQSTLLQFLTENKEWFATHDRRRKRQSEMDDTVH